MSGAEDKTTIIAKPIPHRKVTTLIDICPP